MPAADKPNIGRVRPSGPGEIERAEARRATLKTYALLGSGALVVLAVTYALGGLIHTLNYHRVVAEIHATPIRALLLAALATAASYAALIGYDLSALRYVGASVPRPVVMLASFCAYALGNTVGLGPLTGGAVRYRFYSAAGLQPREIARVILFCVLAFALGIASVAGLPLLIAAPVLAELVPLPPFGLRLIGLGLLAATGGFLALCAFGPDFVGREPLRVPLPSLRLALLQLALAVIDIGVSAAVLWVLLPPMPIGFVAFAAVYAAAIALGVASHVPGGVGVFEGAILLVFGRHVPSSKPRISSPASPGVACCSWRAGCSIGSTPPGGSLSCWLRPISGWC